MVKGLMVQPWSLGQPENIWHGMLTAVHTCAASYISPQAASKVFIQRGSPDSLGCRLINSGALADPELQRRGGQILAEIFERPFFRRFPKKFCHSPKNCHLSPKISDDLLLVVDLFLGF